MGSGNVLRAGARADAGSASERGSHVGGRTFRLTIRAISGRPLLVAVDQKGVGAGSTFVSEDPRVLFTEVASDGLDWSFTIQERVK